MYSLSKRALYWFYVFHLMKRSSPYGILKRAEGTGCQKVLYYRDGKGSWDTSVLSDEYTLALNAWGSDKSSKDSYQQVSCLGSDQKGVSWTTTYSWNLASPQERGPPKSFANLSVRPKTRKRINEITKIITTWIWKYTTQLSSDHMGNVAFEMWTSPDQNCKPAQPCATNEIMFWFTRSGGMVPVGRTTGNWIPLGACNFEVYDGILKSKYDGKDARYRVISMVPEKDCLFADDNVWKVISWLVQNMGIKDTDYLTDFQSGTEVIKGFGTLQTDKFLMKIS